MRMVIDNVNSEHIKWLTEMAKTLQFKVVEVELTEDEEDEYLLAEMKIAADEKNASSEEINDFKQWLRSSK